MIGYGIWGSEKAAGTRHIHQEIFLPQYFPPLQMHGKAISYQSQAGEGPAAVLLLFSCLPVMIDFFICC